MSRTYIRPAETLTANLLVAWFQTQSHGARQPHSPQVCLPGAGWTPVVNDRLDISIPRGTLRVNRYVAGNRRTQAVVLYWYHTSRRDVASEWASKFWTVWDAVSVKRTDIALIRVVTWPRAGDYQSATVTGATFIADLYPQLQNALSR